MKFSTRAFLLSAAIIVAPAMASSAHAYTLTYTGSAFTESEVYGAPAPVDPAFGTSLDFKIVLDLPSNYTGSINSDASATAADFTSFTYTPVGGVFVIDDANVAANTTILNLVDGLPVTWSVAATNNSGLNETINSDWNGTSGNDTSTGVPYSTTTNIESNTPGVWAIAGADAVPEPATWGMMLLGLGMIGAATRAARRRVVAAV